MKEILDFVQHEGCPDGIMVKHDLKGCDRPTAALGRSASTS
jgi:hypothetical protein